MNVTSAQASSKNTRSKVSSGKISPKFLQTMLIKIPKVRTKLKLEILKWRRMKLLPLYACLIQKIQMAQKCSISSVLAGIERSTFGKIPKKKL